MTRKMLSFENALQGERILVTGHSGFTGSWVCHWLTSIGVSFYGYSLAPNTTPSLFEASGLAETAAGQYSDLMDVDALMSAFKTYKPTLVLHLAAQPLVRPSYEDPVHTFAVNALGTANLLDAARKSFGVKGVVCITTDKVYHNNEWVWGYRETDRLGGKDPYSASKAAAEIIISSFRDSFANGPAIAVARGGNIIGGGDWAVDRLIPDFVRAVVEGKSITLRYPDATRPWQHVLALVEGYLILLAGLVDDPAKHERAWNLGPSDPAPYSVKSVFEILCDLWKRPDIKYMKNPVPESGALGLDSSLANLKLGWEPKWDTQRAIAETALWYKDYYADPGSCRKITLRQINAWRER